MTARIAALVLAACVLAAFVLAVHAEAPWPQFRGPGGRGIAAGDALPPDRWSTTDNVSWKRDIPGRELWKAPRDEKSNDLDCNLLWSLEGMSSITIATPFEADRLLYVTSGYDLDPRKPSSCIKPGATGDISLDAGAEFKILHTMALADDDMGMATPAIVGQRLLLRTAAGIYCFAPQGTAAVVPAGAPGG